MKSAFLFLLIILPIRAFTQKQSSPVIEAWESFSKHKKQSEFAGLQWDLIGPVINSGRIEALDVVPDNPGIIYAGFGSGNLWKTNNHGLSWEAIFDDHAGYSIGDVRIAPSNSNIIYLATGESLRAKRGHTISGAGVYRSDDAGETWRSLGLEKSFHIGRIRVHPTNPNIVFVAALGNFYSPNKERGIYKTKNGGKSWRKVLYVDERTGGNDVIFAPTNPQILYASTWQCSEVKAGPGSSLYKSIDGGDTWQKIDHGFPSGPLKGRTGLAVSYQNSDKVYAFTDNVNAGYEQGSGELYQTQNGGISWRKTHDSNLKILSSFGEVFTDCFVNPQNDEEVYLLGINVLKTSDGGQTFQPLRGHVKTLNPAPTNTFHLDHHDLWINPKNPSHLLVGNDGGLFITYDTGGSWTQYNNVPVGEFYFVRTDNDQPYNIYSGTQDDSAVRGPAKQLKANSPDEWEYVWIDVWGGGDGIVTTPDREDSDIVYYESQNGDIRRKRMSTGKSKYIKPNLPEITDAELFNEWLTPFFTSTHQQSTLYYGANFLFKSMDRGDTWKVISPDLSASSDPQRRGNGITATEESPIAKGLLYAGTSKGATWVSLDDGVNWTEISKGLAPKYIKSFAPSSHQDSRVYVAQSGISEDDFEAYLYRSDDYGKTWISISSNLPAAPINVILEDPYIEGVLYCGTFNGVFVSENGGDSWKVLGSEMPNVFVSDLTIQTREKDLIAATHGRGIYKMDLEPLYKHWEINLAKATFLYHTPAILPKKDASGRKPDLSTYEKMAFHFQVPQAGELQLRILNENLEAIFTDVVSAQKGLNSYVWDLMLAPRTPDDSPYAFRFHNFVEAGNYTIQLEGAKTKIERTFIVKEP
ncbi:MAG: hypothetical protein Sapg2KO_42910 [Saprospiraceae bacterium]